MYKHLSDKYLEKCLILLILKLFNLPQQSKNRLIGSKGDKKSRHQTFSSKYK